MKKISIIFLAVILFSNIINCLTVRAIINDEEIKIAKENLKDEIILNACNYSLENIIGKLEEIDKAGYSIIEISPIQGTKSDDLDGSKWWLLSQPINQDIGNAQIGNKDDLINLCTEAKKTGIKIIVQVELNHMAFSEDNETLSELVVEEFKDIDLYHDLGKCDDWSNRWAVTQKNIKGMDLNTQNPNVQEKALKFLNDCIDAGVSGFRFNKANYIETSYGEDLEKGWASDYWEYILGNLKNKESLLIYGDIKNCDANNEDAYKKYMNISSEKYADSLLEAVRSNKLKNIDINNKISSQYFENEDSFYLGESKNLSENERKICWAILSARKDVSPIFFSRPSNKIGNIGEDFYNHEDIKVLNKFHKDMKGLSENIRLINDNAMLIERGRNGAVLVNNGEHAVINIETNLEDGMYENKISDGGTFVVSNGRLIGNIKKKTVAVFYKEKIVYFKSPSNWNEASIYVYKNKEELSEWPGKKMIYDNNKGLYYYIFPEGWNEEAVRVIFNNRGDVLNQLENQIPQTGKQGFLCDKVTSIFDSSKEYKEGQSLEYYSKDGFFIGGLTTDKSSPQTINKEIKIYAGASGCSGKIQYEFYEKLNGKEIIIRNYSEQNNASWNPRTVGMYILGVRAKNENGEIIRKEINYEIKDELSITNFSIDCMSPQEIKKTINISADSIGGTGKILYKFYIKDKNETKILQDFNENKTVKWVPDTPGNYKIIVEVKDSTGNIVKNEKSDFVINDKLKINTFDTNYINGQEIGKKVLLTGNASGGNGYILYKFLYKKDNTYKLIRDFDTENTVTWIPETSGNYKLILKVKDKNSKEIEKVIENYNVSESIKITNFSLSKDGNGVDIQAKASGGVGKLKYKFVAKYDDEYEIIQDYSENNMVKWLPQKNNVTCTLTVQIKDENGNIINKIIDRYFIGESIYIDSFTTDKTSPQVSGTKVILKVEASGEGTLQYKFLIKDNKTGNWAVLREYGTSNTYTWATKTIGDKTLYVDVKDSTGKVVRSQMSYKVIKPLVISSFIADKESPQISETKVPLKVEASGEGILQYKFLIKDNKTGNWAILRDYGTSNTYTWTTKTTGDKTLYVDVKDSTGKVVRSQMSYKVIKPLVISSFIADKESPQISGTKVTLKVEASGEGTLQYKFLIKDSLGNWALLRDYGTSNSYVWTTKQTGDKTLYVDVKDENEQVVRDSIKYIVK